MSSKSNIIDVGKQYCETEQNCPTCPLYKLPCINDDGIITLPKETTIEDMYDFIMELANFDGDNDFMK